MDEYPPPHPVISVTAWSETPSSELIQCFNCSLDGTTDFTTGVEYIAANASRILTNTTCLWPTCGLVDAINVTNSTVSRTVSGSLPSAPSMNAWTSVQFSILPILLLIIACVGLIGNALNLLVLYSYHTTQIACGGECTARVNLLGLALADFLVCLTSLPIGYVQRRHESYSFMLFYTIIGPGLVTYFLVVSVWMVLLMSVIRYMAVCRPLTSRAWLTPRHMFRVIVIIYLVGLLFHIPSFFMFTYETESVLQKKNTVTKCRPISRPIENLSFPTIANRTEDCVIGLAIFVFERPIWRSEAIYIGYHVIHILLTNIGPFIGVLISNIAVIRACRRSDECRRSFMESTCRDGTVSTVTDQSPPRRLLFRANVPNTGNPTGLYLLNQQQCVAPIRFSLQRYPNSATNRVTPLLLAVIIAFLLFTAPFGIVHFVCLQVMRKLGGRVRDNREARQLYTALNLTVEWTNVVQLLGCALNFFLYFLVSTIFRRTTKRTFRRLYKQLRSCRTELLTSLFLGKTSKSMDSWEHDTRTNELRRELEYKVAPGAYIGSRIVSGTTNRGARSSRRSSINTAARLVKLLNCGKKRKPLSISLPTKYSQRSSIPRIPQADLLSAHNIYESRLRRLSNENMCRRSLHYPLNRIAFNHSPLVTHCVHCDHARLFHHSVPRCNSCLPIPVSSSCSHQSARSEPQYCAVHCSYFVPLEMVQKSAMCQMGASSKVDPNESGTSIFTGQHTDI